MGSASSRRPEGGCHRRAGEIHEVGGLLDNPLGIYIFIDPGLYSVPNMVQKSRCDSRGVWEGRQAGIGFGGGGECGGLVLVLVPGSPATPGRPPSGRPAGTWRDILAEVHTVQLVHEAENSENLVGCVDAPPFGRPYR